MERLTNSWTASKDVLEGRLSNGLLPRFDGFPTVLRFLDPHDFAAIVCANAAYLLVVFGLVRVIKARGPVSDAVIKPVMIIYNACCVALAGAVVFGIVRYKAFVRPGSFACNSPDLETAEGKTLSWYIWLYYAQKYFEYLDTVFFALRGPAGLRQLSFLHVYHHVSITFVTSFFLVHDVNGDCYLAALANSFVHVLMYSHYGLSALNINCWWRKHLTTIQLVQFLTVFTQATIMWRSGPACGYPDWTKFMMLAYQFSMLVLFARFFAASYGTKGKNKSKGAKAL
jgi:elongation of very long chain fatty acids protein 4